MRAGQLDRTIQIQDVCDVAIDEYGTPTKTWQWITVRAQMLSHDSTNREGVRSSTDTTITFRIYFLPGVTLDNRVLYDGQQYKIQKIRELGRRAGLDLVVERVGP